MIKSALRLVAIALVANALWHVFTAYMAHYRFKDAVENVSQSIGSQTDAQLASRVIEVAGQYDIPVTAGSVTVRHEGVHTIIEGSYTKPVDVVPWTSYAWPFSWHVDTIAARGAPLSLPAEQ